MTDREKLMNLVDSMTHKSYSRLVVESIADYFLDKGVVFREKGDWQYGEDDCGTYYECPVCGCQNSNYDADEGKTNFCPECGADMRERKTDATD